LNRFRSKGAPISGHSQTMAVFGVSQFGGERKWQQDYYDVAGYHLQRRVSRLYSPSGSVYGRSRPGSRLRWPDNQ